MTAPSIPSLKSIVAREKRRAQMHISAINMMADCGQRFFYRYILGLKRPPHAALLVGQSTHHSVRANLDHKITSGDLMPRADAVGAAEEKFDNEQRAQPIELDPDEKREGLSLQDVLAEAKEKTLSLAGLHYDKAAPNLTPTFTERQFSINMDVFLRARAKELHTAADTIGDQFMAKRMHAQAASMNAAARIGIDFAGAQDIVEKGDAKYLVIRDTKTSTKSPSDDIANNSDQLSGYATASYVIDGQLPTAMILDYLIRTPQKHDLKYIPKYTTRSMNDVQMFLNRFANAVQAYRSGVFVPARSDWWGCSERWCAYWGICPYAKRPTVIQITKDAPNVEAPTKS